MKMIRRILPWYFLYALILTLIISSYVGGFPSAVKVCFAYMAGLALAILLCALPITARWIVWVEEQLLQCLKKCWDSRRQAGKVLLMLLVDALLAFAIERLLAYLFYEGASFYLGRYIVSFGILVLISFFFRYREIVAKKAEVAVFVVILSVGTMLVTTMPASCGVSWDDETHFKNALLMSHFLDREITEADTYILEKFSETALEHIGYDREGQTEWNEKIDTLYLSGKSEQTIRVWPRYNKLCYIPSAVGLLVGRGLHLPYHITFKLGRWFNLLFYAIMVYLSLRKLKSGKMIGAVVSMLPFNLFLASSYSYDPWLTVWMLYGLCCFFGELQQPQKKMRTWEWIVMLLAFFIGVGSKPIYIPLVLATLLMPKEKFANPRQRKFMIVVVLIVLLLAAASFFLPFLMSNGAYYQDNRGGDAVDSTAQVMYILENPSTYAGTLIKFLTEYLSLTSAVTNVAYLAYFSNVESAGFGTLVVVMMWVVAFTDKETCDCEVKALPRMIVIALSFVTVCLAATSMYIAFTGVGANTILGCQFRYLSPLFFPVMYVIGSGKIENRMKREYYNGIILTICSFVPIYALWTLAINLY